MEDDVKELFTRKNGVEVKRPTNRRTWKNFETALADFFGGKRTPLSGMSNNLTKSDIIHPTIFVECKFRGRIPFFEKYLLAQEEYEREEKFLAKKERRPVNIKSLVYKLKNYQLYDGDIWLFYSEKMEEVCAAAQSVTDDEGITRMIIMNKLVKLLELKNQNSIVSLYAETERKALLEDKTPVVALKMKNKRGWLFVINPKYLVTIFNLIYGNNTGSEDIES